MHQLLNLSACNWRFRNARNEHYHLAAVPGCVHTDLYSQQADSRPFLRPE